MNTTFEAVQAQRISALYGVSEAPGEDILTKSELSRALDLQKGGADAQLGETRVWGQKVYKKTVDGWDFLHKLSATDNKDASTDKDDDVSQDKDVEQVNQDTKEAIAHEKQSEERQTTKDHLPSTKKPIYRE